MRAHHALAKVGAEPPDVQTTTGPTRWGFNTFIYDVMQIDPLYLPHHSPIIGYAYTVALGMTDTLLRGAGRMPGSEWSIYALAVYNLGGSNIINFAQDQPGRTYFADKRKEFGITKFQMGVVSGASDEGTATSLLNPEFMKTLTLQNLQALKDPWGRQYLMFAQATGPLWGIT
jgi:hypothetical protein